MAPTDPSFAAMPQGIICVSTKPSKLPLELATLPPKLPMLFGEIVAETPSSPTSGIIPQIPWVVLPPKSPPFSIAQKPLKPTPTPSTPTSTPSAIKLTRSVPKLIPPRPQPKTNSQVSSPKTENSWNNSSTLPSSKTSSPKKKTFPYPTRSTPQPPPSTPPTPPPKPSKPNSPRSSPNGQRSQLPKSTPNSLPS